MWGGGRTEECHTEVSSTGTILVWRGLLVGQLRALLGTSDRWVGCVEGLGHLFTNDVHQALEGLLDVDVVLGAGLKKLKAWQVGRRHKTHTEERERKGGERM